MAKFQKNNLTMKNPVNTAELLPPFEELFNAAAMRKMIIRPEARALAKKIGNGENLFIFVGSSGAGRDTILEECLTRLKTATRIRRTTTRKPRETVKDEKRMIFITEKAFLRDFKSGKVIFAGRYKANKQLYGIGRDEILKIGERFGGPCLLEENFSGLALKMMLPQAKLIVIFPPSLSILRERLFSRGGSEEENQKRFEVSVSEIKAVVENLPEMLKEKLADMVIINDGKTEKVGEKVTRAIRGNKKIIEDFRSLTNSLVTLA